MNRKEALKKAFEGRKKHLTADEVREQFETDPLYARVPAEKKAEILLNIQTIEEQSKPLLQALDDLGMSVVCVWEILDRYKKLYPVVIDTLLEHLPRVSYPRLKENIVRVIGLASSPYDGRVLASEYDCASDKYLKWAICDTFARTRPQNVDDWMIKTLGDSSGHRNRGMLCTAVARHLPDRAPELLCEVFAELPDYAAEGLALCGGQPELEFLQGQISSEKVWTKEHLHEIQKAIRRIERRLARQPKKSKKRNLSG